MGKHAAAAMWGPEAAALAVAWPDPEPLTLDLLADKLVELKIVDRISRQTVWQTLKKTNCALTCASSG